MTFYEQELKRIKQSIYSNQFQIDTVIATKHFIDTNYEKDLNLELLSKILLTSKFHLLRLFKKNYGVTPKQYHINLRIQKSRELLKSGVSVTETCFSVGFESLGSFSALFKSRTGYTPSEFQKSNFREAS
ncbi:MAG: AraC family transcriptional regulator [Bacteroidota bacterium]